MSDKELIRKDIDFVLDIYLLVILTPVIIVIVFLECSFVIQESKPI